MMVHGVRSRGISQSEYSPAWSGFPSTSASPRNGASVRNRDRGERDILRHAAPLTERISLRLGPSRGECWYETDRRRVKPPGSHHLVVSKSAARCSVFLVVK